MRQGVNVVRLTRPFTGVGRYVECLLREWAHMDLPFDDIVLFAPARIREDLAAIPLNRFRVEVVGPKLPDPVWEWSSLRRASRDVDVLFCPSYTVPRGYRGRCAVTYHGPALIRRFGAQFLRVAAYDRLHRYSARRAGIVFTCSRAVKRRVVEVYGVPSKQVSVTYMAPSHAFAPTTDAAVRAHTRKRYLGSDDPYVLFVGKLSDRHFIPEMLEAFASSVRRASLPHRMLVVGPDVRGFDVARRARRLGMAERIVHVPFVKHLDLPAVYGAADFFLYPASDAEGFGIPVLEAMACGTPVISTNRGGVSEVARDSAFLVENSSVEELSAAIEHVAEDAEMRDRLRESGLQRSSQITWRFTAEKTMRRLWRLASEDLP